MTTNRCNRCDACGGPAPGVAFLCPTCERRLPSEHIEGLNRAAQAGDREHLALAQEIVALLLKRSGGRCGERGCCTPAPSGRCAVHGGTGAGGAPRFGGGAALRGDEGDEDAA